MSVESEYMKIFDDDEQYPLFLLILPFMKCVIETTTIDMICIIILIIIIIILIVIILIVIIILIIIIIIVIIICIIIFILIIIIILIVIIILIIILVIFVNWSLGTHLRVIIRLCQPVMRNPLL